MVLENRENRRPVRTPLPMQPQAQKMKRPTEKLCLKIRNRSYRYQEKKRKEDNHEKIAVI
jgi:hypothetical protein